MCFNTLQGSSCTIYTSDRNYTTPMSIVTGQYDDENWMVHIVGDKQAQP